MGLKRRWGTSSNAYKIVYLQILKGLQSVGHHLECGGSASAFMADHYAQISTVNRRLLLKSDGRAAALQNTKAPGWATGAFVLPKQHGIWLERELRRNLQTALTAAAKHWIANPYVTGHRQRQNTLQVPVRSKH